MNNNHIEIITWIDATGGDGWINKKELDAEKLIPFDMVGYVLAEDESCVKIAMAYCEETDHIGAYMVIPKSMISNRKIIQ
jgi:hypothetical protein